MAPKSGLDDGPVSNVDSELLVPDDNQIVEEKIQPYKRKIVWRNVILYSTLHVGAAYGFYVAVTKAMWLTLVWGKLCEKICELSIFTTKFTKNS